MGRLRRKIMGFIRDHRNVRISSIKSMKFRYTVGCFMNADIWYGISFEDGKYVACVKPKLKSSEEARTFAVDEAFVEEIRAFLSDMGVGAWNGFKKVDKRVCDGRDFDLRLETHDGQVLYAHGYERYPKNFPAVRDRLRTVFEGLLEE
ncbi:MAG: hypothetical protein IJC49_00980 [Clostridia bacterium]|nr:hypothetical protein [Clostridia bacterium]